MGTKQRISGVEIGRGRRIPG